MVIILVMHSKKVVMKSQIIGVYPYMIPHFNTNKLLQAFFSNVSISLIEVGLHPVLSPVLRNAMVFC